MISPLAGGLAQLTPAPAPVAPAADPLIAEAIAATVGSHVLLGGAGERVGLGRAISTAGKRVQKWSGGLASAMDEAAMASPEMAPAAIDTALQAVDAMGEPPPVRLERPIQAAVDRLIERAGEAGHSVGSYSTDAAAKTNRAMVEGTAEAVQNLARGYGHLEPPKAMREAYRTLRPALAEAAGRPDMANRRAAEASEGLRALDPQLADQVAELARRRESYLLETMPKAPDGFDDDWEPADSDLWSWARRVHAADRPEIINDEIAAGIVMPETVETLERLSPVYLDRVREEVTRALAEPGTKIPYPMRTGLALVLGIDDPELRPEAIAASQARFASAEQDASERIGPTGAPGQSAPPPSRARYAPSRLEPRSTEQIKMEFTRAQKLENR